jgi:hypothetical protein
LAWIKKPDWRRPSPSPPAALNRRSLVRSAHKRHKTPMMADLKGAALEALGTSDKTARQRQSSMK